MLLVLWKLAFMIISRARKGSISARIHLYVGGVGLYTVDEGFLLFSFYILFLLAFL